MSNVASLAIENEQALALNNDEIVDRFAAAHKKQAHNSVLVADITVTVVPRPDLG
jgi:hypothetical protein